MAVQKDAPIITFIDVETGFSVVVGGAEGLPAASGRAANPFEPVEEDVDPSWAWHLPNHCDHLLG